MTSLAQRWLRKPQGVKSVRHNVLVHFLAMDAPPKDAAWEEALRFPQNNGPRQENNGTRLARLSPDAAALYRQLYDEVGRPWHWVSRRNLGERALQDLLSRAGVEVYVLWRGEDALGFVELDCSRPHDAEIVFLGLRADSIGKGHGRAMLRFAIARASARLATRIRIQTCSLDHPSALEMYKQHGFKPVRSERTVLLDDF